MSIIFILYFSLWSEFNYKYDSKFTFRLSLSLW